MLDSNGRLSHNLLNAGYDKYSAHDLAWQSLHMAAAAACRGSTASGGTAETRWWQETLLTGRVVLRFAPRLLTATVTQRFQSTARKARPQRTEWSWASFTITAVTKQPVEGVRCPVLTILSEPVVTTVSVAVESSIRNSFVTRLIKIIVVKEV